MQDGALNYSNLIIISNIIVIFIHINIIVRSFKIHNILYPMKKTLYNGLPNYYIVTILRNTYMLFTWLEELSQIYK